MSTLTEIKNRTTCRAPTKHASAAPPALCQHCGLRPVNSPRGLCGRCYQTYAIRALYPFVPQADRYLCRHCGLRPINSPRGLCRGCYSNPRARPLYSPVKRLNTHPCLHCRQRLADPANGSRGLCHVCSRDPALKARYPSKSDPRLGQQEPTVPIARVLAARPTDARPGTPEKIAVLEARAAAGEYLWHPLDYRDQD